MVVQINPICTEHRGTAMRNAGASSSFEILPSQDQEPGDLLPPH
jgi:hypothetical protein